VRAAVALVLACVSLAPLDAERSGRAWKPVSFAILEDYDKGADLQDVERDFALFRELGINAWRGSFGWDDYEPARGQYDFGWLHRFVERAAAHRLILRPYLAYTPEWAGGKGSDADAWNNAPRHDADWSRFVAAMAAALKRHANIASFEIYNEENVRQWWDSTAGRYAQVLAAGSRAIREANPRSRVLFGGLVFPDASWVWQVCASSSARAFDILPVHAYPETWTPPGVTAENYLGGLASFAATADRACGRKAVWVNETGFATVPGKSERQQAEWWVRAIGTFLATPRVEHIGVYEIKDLAADKPAIGDTPNYHLGLTGVDRRRKLAFETVKMLVSLLDTGSIAVADDELIWERRPEGAYAHLFDRPDGDRVLIAWTKQTNARLKCPARPDSQLTEYALDGRARQVERPTAIDLTPGEPRVFRIRGSVPQ
jgi:polysaccharide biosynthesis protein PslG